MSNMIFTASEGMWLTQKANVPIEQRIITKEVRCTAKGFAKAWMEITDEKKQEYDAELEAYNKQQEEEYLDGDE